MRLPAIRSTQDRATRIVMRAIGLGFLLAASAQAAVITVGQPGETGCDHLSLQAAINDAAARPGSDILRLSAGAYIAQRVTIADSADLAIQGGYLSCATPVANAGTTTLSGQGASPAGSVITHQGPGRLTLNDLTITGGNASAGGGIQSTSMAALTLARVFLHSNQATVGGGLAVTGLAGQFKQVDLLGVAFVSNIAAASGGGLYAHNAQVSMTGNDPSYFSGNWAQGTGSLQGGGAVYANNSHLMIHSLPNPQFPFMDDNFASQSRGGAIAMFGTAPGHYFLTLMNRDSSRPLVIANNAAGKGGAIYMQTGGAGGTVQASATLFNAIVEDNDAGEGGAFYIDAADANHTARSSLTMMRSTVGMAAPPCPASLRCNRVQGNYTGLSSTVSVQSGSGMGQSSFSMIQGHMVDNLSPNGGLLDGTGFMSADNSVLANNVAGGSYLAYTIGNELRILNSTVAGNVVNGPQVFAVILSPGVLTLHNSIVFQPGKPVQIAATGATANIRNLLVGDGHGLANVIPLNIQQTFDPLFVNPGQHNFQLQPGSQARNRWSPGGGVIVPSVDLLGATRPADPPGTPTPYDYGAYEYGGIVDPLFVGTFEN